MTSPNCFCKHAAHPHEKCAVNGCTCKGYRARPCTTCGHPASLHDGRCKDKACSCRKYLEDETAEFLLEMGVHAGEWQFISVPQLQFLMRPHHTPMVRVWACGMVHSVGQRSRRAVKTIYQQKKSITVPLAPRDILEELNGLDNLGRLDRHVVRKALAELEEKGAVRRVGKQHHNVQLFFYAKPLRAKAVAAQLELVAPDESVSCQGNPNEVEKPDPFVFTSDLKSVTWTHDQILSIRKTFVKSFYRVLRAQLPPNEVVKPDHLKMIDEKIDAFMEVVWNTYLEVVKVVCKDPIYKEDSIYSSKSKQAEETADPIPEVLPACPTPTEIRIEELKVSLERFFPGEMGAEFLAKIDGRLKGAPIPYYTARIEKRWQKEAFGSGLLLTLADVEAKAHKIFLGTQDTDPKPATAAELPPEPVEPETVECPQCHYKTLEIHDNGVRVCRSKFCLSRQAKPRRARTGTEG